MSDPTPWPEPADDPDEEPTEPWAGDDDPEEGDDDEPEPRRDPKP